MAALHPSVEGQIGRPLFLDSATTAGTRPSVARVCVEVDVVKPVVLRVWVAIEGETDFWQRIVTKDMPSYCSICCRLGHSLEECKKSSSEFTSRHQGHQHMRLQRHAQMVAPVCNPSVNGNKENDFIAAAPTKDGSKAFENRTEVAVEGTNLTGSDVLAARTDRQEADHSCSNDIALVAKMGGEIETLASAGYGYQVTCNGAEGSLGGEKQEIHAQLVTENGHDCDENLALGNQYLGEKQQSMAAGTAMESFFVDLHGEEDRVYRDHGEIEAGLSNIAGNLSPRMVVQQARVIESSVSALNIDQSMVTARDFKQARGKGSIIMSFVHAKRIVEERRYLWRNLLVDKPNSHPWYIGGDFNVITAPHEKRGDRPFAVDEGVELVSFMEEAGVLDVDFSGSSFTWCNNQRAVQKAEVAVQPAEHVADQDDTEESQVALRKAQAELRYALSIEE
ncbi:uncharacterized protein [Coffea arabica]|uniref:DUF4283 domain-containing protein n=1 Tax=Coffea arabica TaxID=13443 RepID=A0ABM4URG8_COFAR